MNNNSFTSLISAINVNAHSMKLNHLDDSNILNPSIVLKEVDDIIPQLNNIPEKLASRMISLSSDYPEIDFLLEREGIGCMSRSDIVVLKGKAKSGKTTFMICIITALLKGEYAGFVCNKKDARVLYVD